MNSFAKVNVNRVFQKTELVDFSHQEHIMNIWYSHTREKLAILSDAAKYDASCASSGAAKRDSRGLAASGRPRAWEFVIPMRRTAVAFRC